MPALFRCKFKTFFTLQLGVILLTGVACAALWLGLVWAVAEGGQNSTRSSRALVHNLSLALEEHARRTIQSVDQALVFLQHRYAQDPEGFDPAALLQHELQPTGLPISISLLDGDGWLVSSSEPMAGRLNYADRQHFRFHRSNPGSRLFIGEPVVTRRTGEIRMRFSRSVTDAQGRFAGVMTILLDPAYFVRLYEGMDVGSTGIISLFSRDGEEFVRRTGTGVTFGGTLRDGPLFDLVSRYFTGEVFEGTVPGSGPLLISAHQLDDLPVGVMLGLSRDGVLTGWRGEVWWALLAGVVLSGVLLALGVFLRHRIRADGAAAESLKRAARAAEAANTATASLLLAVTRAQRGPLTAILDCSEMMVRQMSGPLDERYRRCAGLIHHSGVHVLEMGASVLDVAGPDDGALAVAQERVDLSPLLDACVEQARGLPAVQGLEVSASVPRDLPAVCADGVRLHRVVMHLLSDAVAAAPPGGTVTLKAAAGLSGVAVTVQGNGENGGAGVMLARTLAGLMGGTLHIDDSPVHGRTITLLFPPDRVLPEVET